MIRRIKNPIWKNSTTDGFTAYELTEPISKKANLSETFIATFCEHRLTVFVGQPQICLYKRSDDIHISGDIIRAGAWEPSGEIIL